MALANWCTGTVTFLLVDVDGNTDLWEAVVAPTWQALTRHIVADAVQAGNQEEAG
jgi:hypothetical protein